MNQLWWQSPQTWFNFAIMLAAIGEGCGAGGQRYIYPVDVYAVMLFVCAIGNILIEAGQHVHKSDQF
jgi:hypothetical protein